MLKISDLYLDKQKYFIHKKILSVPCTMYHALFSANRWCLDVLTFLIKGFGTKEMDKSTFLSKKAGMYLIGAFRNNCINNIPYSAWPVFPKVF